MKRSLGYTFVNHPHVESVQQHQRIILILFETLPLLKLPQEEHDGFG